MHLKQRRYGNLLPLPPVPGGGDIVDILEILGSSGAKGDELLGEISEEKAHKRLLNG